MIRVVVAARSAIVRAGLEALVADASALTVVGTASHQEALLQQISALQPEVILIEADGQDDDFFGLFNSLSQSIKPPATVLLVDETDATGISEAFRSGVQGILPKAAIASEIQAAIEAVAAGLIVLHPDLREFLLLPPAIAPNPTTPSISEPLTPREVEVLQMLAEGLGNKAIARRLTISEHTVKFHISSIFSKLQVSSRTEAAIAGTRLGLILL